MPAPESSSCSGGSGGAFRESPLPDQLDCCKASNCDHQLQQLVYCYYGFRPFLDNAQVQLHEACSRSPLPAEEAGSRSCPTRRRPGRGHTAAGGRGSRSRPAASAERSSSSHGTSSTSGQVTAAGQWQTRSRTATSTPPAQSGNHGRQARGAQKREKTASRSAAAAAPVRNMASSPAPSTPPSASSTGPPALPASHRPPLLPTPSSPSPSFTKRSVLSPSGALLSRSQSPRPIVVSAPAPVLRSSPPPPPPPLMAPLLQEADGHLAAMLDRLSLLATPPGALPAFVRVPPPSVDGAFCGSRSHGSLEVELERCRLPTRRRHRSGDVSLPDVEEVAGGAAYSTPPPPCCPGTSGHQDSYDPRLDVPPVSEERSHEQMRSERLLKNFDMFRDWDYVPFVVEPSLQSGAPAETLLSRRAHSIDSSSGSDSDDESEPTVTICRRVGGVFHYIPAQRLLKNATSLRADLTDTDG